jgi:hypothetical protein
MPYDAAARYNARAATSDESRVMNACRQTIDMYLRRDLGAWRGLAAGCREDALEWLSFRDGKGRTVLGAEHVEYAFRMLDHPGFTAPVGFHFRAGTLAFVATEYWSLDAGECAALLRQLGEPAHRLDLAWRHTTIAGGAWAYVERGLTLGVIPATGLIAKAIAYPPCTLAEYAARYHAARTAREFRARPRTREPKER